MSEKQARELLSGLPSVDELLKSSSGQQWLSLYTRRLVIQGIREVLSERRSEILKGAPSDLRTESLLPAIERTIVELSSYSLIPVINATGIVLHTNLGRAVMSKHALENVLHAGSGYSNLEYDLAAGKRGKRHVHTTKLLREITGAEDAFIVNNNAAAVMLCLNTLAKGREVIVSRGELVEIGGSFRVPDVMSASGAILREVGTTNKTHAYDYVRAINENTALILKVHQSNYKIVGFTEEVGIRELVSIGNEHRIPVMFDLGSGSLIDLKPYGVFTEPSVSEILKTGVDLLSFSGDKLLGGPQGGIIAGRKGLVEQLRKNPIARALRIDKMTIAAFEATLMDYLDPETAIRNIPVLSLLFQSLEEIRSRAQKIASRLKKTILPGSAEIEIAEEQSKAGGGSLPEMLFPTFVVRVRTLNVSVNEFELRLRKSKPPVIGRIAENALLLDARTISNEEVSTLAGIVAGALETSVFENRSTRKPD